MAKQHKGRPPRGPAAQRGGAQQARPARPAAADREQAKAERAHRVAEREEAKRRATARAKRQRVLRVGAVVVVIGAVLAVLLGREIAHRRAVDRIIAATADQATAAKCSSIDNPGNAGRKHIERGEAATGYTSDPPTSGPHFTTTAGEGVSEAPVEEQLLIHNLEHGGVVVHHKGLPDTALTALKEQIADNDGKVLLVPDESLEAPGVAYTGWRRLQTCATYDPDVLSTFLKLYLDPGAKDSSAPEKGRSI